MIGAGLAGSTRVLAAVLLVALLAFPQEAAARRLALVVGNSDYVTLGTLPNAANDARAFAAFLERHDFEVLRVIDADRPGLARALADFSDRIGPDDIALFYFAGHGMQMRGENFLLGRDARLETEFDVAAEGLALDAIVALMERKAAISLLFIDACRNNPVADRLNTKVEGVTRSGATRGLAPIAHRRSETMIAFAASPGEVAYDGDGDNSPFTLALVDHLATPGLEIETAFRRVIREVRDRTGDRQLPQRVSTLTEEVYLLPRGASETAVSEAAEDGMLIVGTEGDLPVPASRPDTGETKEVAAISPAVAPPAMPEKFTQRLLPDGSEVDEGPAGEAASTGAQPQATAAPSAAAVGHWSMQIASEPTARQAQAVYADLARRYRSLLEGRNVDFVRVHVAGAGDYYRVRIPAQSRDDAVQLCNDYKSAGGHCFVSR